MSKFTVIYQPTQDRSLWTVTEHDNLYAARDEFKNHYSVRSFSPPFQIAGQDMSENVIGWFVKWTHQTEPDEAGAMWIEEIP